MKDLSKLPDNLPIPIDDGACDHLLGTSMPTVSIGSTSGEAINLGELSGVAVFYFFPMMAAPALCH